MKKLISTALFCALGLGASGQVDLGDVYRYNLATEDYVDSGFAPITGSVNYAEIASSAVLSTNNVTAITNGHEHILICGQSNARGNVGSIFTTWADLPSAWYGNTNTFLHWPLYIQEGVAKSTSGYDLYISPCLPVFTEPATGKGHGCEVSLANILQKELGGTNKVYTTKPAVGSTSLVDDWLPIGSGLYTNVHQTINDTCAQWGIETNLTAAVWFLHESDVSAVRAPQESNALVTVFTDLRSTYGSDLPIVIVGLGSRYKSGEYDPDDKTYGWDVIDAQARLLASSDPNIEYVYAADLPYQTVDSPPIHYSSEGQITLGGRIAAAVLKLRTGFVTEQNIGADVLVAKESVSTKKLNVGEEINLNGQNLLDIMQDNDGSYATSPAGLVAYWPLDGSYISNAYDTAEYHDDGDMAYASVIRYVPFVTNRVEITNSLDISNSDGFTISLWCRLTQELSGDAYPIFIGDTVLTNSTYLRLSTANSFIRFAAATAGGSQQYVELTGQTFETMDDWIHLGGVIDRETETIVLYVNGAGWAGHYRHESSLSATPVTSLEDVIGIGWGTTRTNTRGCDVVDVAFYDRPLTKSDIRRIYLAGRGNFRTDPPPLNKQVSLGNDRWLYVDETGTELHLRDAGTNSYQTILTDATGWSGTNFIYGTGAAGTGIITNAIIYAAGRVTGITTNGVALP